MKFTPFFINLLWKLILLRAKYCDGDYNPQSLIFTRKQKSDYSTARKLGKNLIYFKRASRRTRPRRTLSLYLFYRSPGPYYSYWHLILLWFDTCTWVQYLFLIWYRVSIEFLRCRYVHKFNSLGISPLQRRRRQSPSPLRPSPFPLLSDWFLPFAWILLSARFTLRTDNTHCTQFLHELELFESRNSILRSLRLRVTGIIFVLIKVVCSFDDRCKIGNTYNWSKRSFISAFLLNHFSKFEVDTLC